MRAVVLDRPGPLDGNPLTVRDVDTPEPGLGQVLVKVAACGVCRSNLHMIEGDWTDKGVPAYTPIVPGHELTGTVAALGPGVDGLSEGDRVGVQVLWSSCGHCEYCLSAREQLCPDKQITGETLDGGYAEYVLATAVHTYRVPDGLDLAEAAPLFCPGITAYGAVRAAQLSPTRSVAVFGVGGVGHMVLQLAGLAAGEVVAVSRGREHRDLAVELGAARTLDPADGDPGERLAADGGVDAAIVFAPSDEVVAQAIAATKPGGRIVLGVWARVGDFPFVDEKTLVGSLIGSRGQMNEVLELAAAGRIRARVQRYPLDRAVDALQDLKDGRIRSRAVLTP